MSTTVEPQKPADFARRAWQTLADKNPVLAKEILVTWRTPAYAGAIVATPILIMGIVLAIRWTKGTDLDASDGVDLVRDYLVWMAIFVGALGAILGSTLVVQDRENGTLEALRFSRVGASSIALAKLASVWLAQAAIVTCTLPLVGYLVAATGASFVGAAVAAGLALALGALTAAVGAGASANAPNTRVALVVSLLGAAVVGVSACGWFAASWRVAGCSHDCDPLDGYVGTGLDVRTLTILFLVPTCAFVLVLWGGIAAAISGLRDASEDRSSPVKLWALAAVALVSVAAYAAAHGAEAETRQGIASAALFVTAVGAVMLHFAFVGEPLSPSRRTRARATPLVLRWIFRPSLVASFCFTLATGGLAFVGIPILVGSPGITVAGAWVWLYLSALGGFMGFVAVTRGPQRARWMGAVTTLLLLVALFQDRSRGAAALDCVCPFWLRNASAAETTAIWACSLALWALTACVMLGLMVHASRKAARIPR